MRLVLCAVLDEKAESYMPPFSVVAIGQAIRLFGDACQNKDDQIGKHPEDYRLYKVAEYDDQTAEIVAVVPVLLSSGYEHKNSLELAR